MIALVIQECFNFNIMKKIQMVCGASFGDEGKGKTVQYLCQEAINKGLKPLVVRYCNGPQASHTVVHDGITHVCSSFGSGVLLNVPTLIYLETDTAIDPIALSAEYDVLIQKGVNPKFYIDGSCSVITPYDVIANRNNKDSLNNGTCGCGVWESLNRTHQSSCLESIWDCVMYSEKYLEEVRDYYKVNKQEKLESKFLSDLSWIKDKIIHWEDCREYVRDFDVIIYESSQGLLLDVDKGFRPYITPARLLPNTDDGKFVFTLIDDPVDIEFYLVTRTYTTRHGAGYQPHEFTADFNGVEPSVIETNKTNSYQGEFKTGVLDVDMINRAIDRHCLNNIENVKWNLVINHMDCVQDFIEVWADNKHKMYLKKYAIEALWKHINFKFDNVLWSETRESKFNKI